MAYLSIAISLIFLLHGPALSQAQPAAAPAPPGPTNITKILEKAGQFGTLIRLLKSTSTADQINGQLNNSNNGLTLFAPTDNAFTSLPSGTLNSLTDQQKVALVQFHVLPNLMTITQFQTASNPLRTQAGDSSNGKYPLNVTAVGNQVNISTGIVNTTVSNTIYSDGQLAVYQVDKVLLPLDIFRPSVAPAPAPTKAKKKEAPADLGPSSSSSKDSSESSDAGTLKWRNSRDIACAALIGFLYWIL
ncbi:FAS1 domain-containing protein [Dioscorea alata]|uniref:FAS1 domain-containing protein n=1 Tax=Dioscorea alata TaxID=55571 RepID=A0ACB7U952_DIOAL|nr:FAS1 domain-containing protein [Dioscorea alata]